MSITRLLEMLGKRNDCSANCRPVRIMLNDMSYCQLTRSTVCLTRPRRFVTFYVSALEILLLTYLLTYVRPGNCCCVLFSLLS